ncbi:MAG TPA: DUF3352 domain-containing protein [Chloroflexota bacterium]|nr:DUF3352 domain-containing protein [Chloroflexota bacterium]
MARRRWLAALLVLSLALVPLRTAAQAPPAAPVALAALYPADTLGYFELQLRPGDDQGPRLERLLRVLANQAPDEEPWAWVQLLPRVARALAVGLWLRGDDVGVVAALAADDPGALLGLLTRFQAGGAPAEPYGDVPIVGLSRSGMGYAAAVGGYLLAANDRAALTATIDRVRAGAAAGPGLGGADRYRAATERLPASRFVTGYLDGPGLAGWIDTLQDRAAATALDVPAGAAPSDAAPGTAPAPRERLPSARPGGITLDGLAGSAGLLGTFSRVFAVGAPDLPEELDRLRAGSLALAVTAAPAGLRLVAETPAAWETRSLPASAAAALRFVPPNALLAVAGNNLAASARPTLEELPPSLTEALPPGLDLQADVLAWMDGEYGIALLPSPPGRAGPLAHFPEVIVLFEVRDPPAVEGKLRSLVRVLASAADRPGFEPVEERQGDVLVRRLPFGQGFNLTWGYLGRWLFLTSGAPGTLVQASAANGLPASPAYTRLARALPSPNVGVYYADAAELARWLGALVGDRFPLNAPGGDRWRELVDLLGDVAGTTGLARDGWIESAAVLELRW